MIFNFKSLNTKSLTLMIAAKKFFPEKCLNFEYSKDILIEKLSLPAQKLEINGFLSILHFLENKHFLNNLSNKDKLIWLTHDLTEKVEMKQDQSKKIKVIKNKNYKTLEQLLSAELGIIDIAAYLTLKKHYAPSDKNKKLAKLAAWFEKIKENVEPEIKIIEKNFESLNLVKKGGESNQKHDQKVAKKEKAKEKAAAAEKEGKQPTEQKPSQQPKPEKPIPAPKKKAQDNIDPAYLTEFNNQKIVRTTKGKEILPDSNKKNILITSALPYVNNVPHLGNIIGCVLSADVYARYCRLRGYNSIYICGTDEYGTATEMKALKEKCTPKEICDKYFAIHKKIYEWFDIDFDYFGRTTTEQQTKIAQDIFNELHAKNKLCYDTLEQSFCEKCVTFLADRYVSGTCPHCRFPDAKGDQCDGCGKLLNPVELIEPKCQVCGHKPIVKSSKHIFLDLPQIQPQLEKWISAASESGFWNNNSKTTTQAWLKTGLKPRCITRDLKWGTPVPLEEYKDKVFYVWFDAPIGYISITANYTENWRKWWKNPAEVKLYQFMGKDNIPFHTVIFPSTLLGTEDNWTLLHHISTTEYLNYETVKFSKSRGTGVFGDNVMEINFPPEIWRYYLLVNRPEKQDTFFTWNDFAVKNNNELLPNLGNLCNRCLKFIFDKFEGNVPSFEAEKLTPQDHEILKKVYSLFKEYLALFDKVEIKEALKLTTEISANCNKYFQDNAPWEKSKLESKRSDIVFVVTLNLIRFLSCLYEPFMPSLSAKINFLLNLEKRSERDDILLDYINNGKDYKILLTLIPEKLVIRKPVVLFNEMQEKDLEGYKLKYSGQQK